MTSVRRWGAVSAFAVVLAIAGCAQEPVEQVPLWEHLLQDPPGLEADPPATFSELVAESELVVRGSVAGVRSGPTDRYTSGDPLVPAYEERSVILELDVSEVLRGEAPETVEVWLSAPVDDRRIELGLPDEEYLWFLTAEHSVEDLYLTTSLAGIVGESVSGLETVRDATLRDVLPPGARTLDELAAQVGQPASAG